uniref:(California timema) hypothetical protein n=1 Tax=Timema californicum TaxID=61474 RepID=A0A7R9IWL9_TIMCA|nr:unnamed protein product [Timema californicum]
MDLADLWDRMYLQVHIQVVGVEPSQHAAPADDWWSGVEEEGRDALSLEALWAGSFVPPPPRPYFLDERDATPDGPTTCDLCTWAWRDREDAAPVQARKKAELLLEHIISRDGISWDENGGVSIHDTPLRGSNIVDLVNGLVGARRHSEPSGWREFLTTLQKIYVPKEFIVNPKRLVTIRDPTPVLQPLTPSQRPKKKKLKRVGENSTLQLQSIASDVCSHYCLMYLLHRTQNISMKTFLTIFSPTNHTGNDAKGHPDGVPAIAVTVVEANKHHGRSGRLQPQSKARPVKPFAITSIFNTFVPLDKIDAKLNVTIYSFLGSSCRAAKLVPVIKEKTNCDIPQGRVLFLSRLVLSTRKTGASHQGCDSAVTSLVNPIVEGGRTLERVSGEGEGIRKKGGAKTNSQSESEGAWSRDQIQPISEMFAYAGATTIRSCHTHLRINYANVLGIRKVEFRGSVSTFACKEVEKCLGENILNGPKWDSSTDLPVIGSPAACGHQMSASTELGWVLTLAIVSVLSAAIGAVIMVTVMQCRSRMKNVGSRGLCSLCLRVPPDSTSTDMASREESKEPTVVFHSDSSPPVGGRVWTWLTARRTTAAPPQLTTSSVPAENHYTVDEAYTAVGEALYAELDRDSNHTPAYQNTAYTGSDIEPDAPVSSAPSSAYYSDLSEHDCT